MFDTVQTTIVSLVIITLTSFTTSLISPVTDSATGESVGIMLSTLIIGILMSFIGLCVHLLTGASKQ